MAFELSRRDALRSGLIVSGVGIAGCAGDVGSDVLLSEGFEDDIANWTESASIGPEEPLPAFEWEIERSEEEAASGDWSLEIFTEGDHDDGTAWVVTELNPPTDTSGFEVSLQAWSESESFNTLRHLVAYLGPARPADEGDFPDPGANSTGIDDAPIGGLREPLHQAEGWREYGFEWRPASTPDSLSFAVGISVVWEADATHYLDDLELRAT